MYHCKIDGRQVPMNDAAIKAAEEDCEIPTRRRRIILLSSILSTSGVVAIALIIIILVKRQRRRRLYERIEGQIGLLREDLTGYKIPVFVSFSSMDDEFIAKEVLGPLQVHCNKFPYVE